MNWKVNKYFQLKSVHKIISPICKNKFDFPWLITQLIWLLAFCKISPVNFYSMKDCSIALYIKNQFDEKENWKISILIFLVHLNKKILFRNRFLQKVKEQGLCISFLSCFCISDLKQNGALWKNAFEFISAHLWPTSYIWSITSVFK